MSVRASPPFRADHVGSLLRPPELLKAREDHAAGRLPREELTALEDEAVRDAVRMQRDVGLRAATDGELRRASWHMDFIYDRVAEAPFNDLGVDGFLMERDDERSGGFEPLRFVPEGKVVVLGLVTTERGDLEAKNDLRRRIEEAAAFVDVDQLCPLPQCGFSSTVEGNALSHEQQAAKLRLVVETADEVWGR